MQGEGYQEYQYNNLFTVLHEQESVPAAETHKRVSNEIDEWES